MTSLTPGRVNWTEVNWTERGLLGHGGRRVLRALVLSSPLVFLSGACADNPKLVVPPGDAIGGVHVDPARCGTGGKTCGEGCCPAGNNCTKTFRCITASACEDNGDCSSDSVCGGGGQCVSWGDYPEGSRYSNSCRTEVDLPSVQPVEQCHWPLTPPTEFPDSVQVIATPMVVDFNFDNDPAISDPSIVFVSYDTASVAGAANGVLRVINGKDCTLQATIAGKFPFTQKVSPALGDIDGDGRPDIVVADEEPNGASVAYGVAAYSPVGYGAPKFKEPELGRTRTGSTAPIQGLALHNVDEDDVPEILTENTLLEFDEDLGNLVIITPLRRTVELTGREPPIVVDIDGDSVPEMVTSQGILVWDTTTPEPSLKDKSRSANLVDDPLWKPDPEDTPGFFMALADLGNFPTQLPQQIDSVEMIVVGPGGRIWVQRVDGQMIHEVDGTGVAGGPPVVADLDGDGRMEFASPGGGRITVFDLDCVDDARLFKAAGCKVAPSTNGMLWQSDQIRGALSGAAVFDFDGDGRAEVVFADQCFMRVYDGLNGEVLFSVPRSSTTSWDYPVVADVDGDQNSEIVTASNNNDTTLNCPLTDRHDPTVAFAATAGVTVWTVEDDTWMGSRPIWNQHNYFVTNVEDDGTVPAKAPSHWNARDGGPNTFRQNVQGKTGSSLNRPDITTAGLPQFTCIASQNLADVTVDLCNRGLDPVEKAEASVALVRTDQATPELCRLQNSQVLAAGKCEPVTCTIPVTKGAAPFDITIYSAGLDECDEANNTSFISRVSCPVDIPIE